MTFTTTAQSFAKYGGRILIWDRQLRSLRNNPTQNVDFYVDNKIFGTYLAADILAANTKGFGEVIPYQKGSYKTTFTAFDSQDIVAQPLPVKPTIQQMAEYLVKNDPRFANVHPPTLQSRLSQGVKRLGINLNSWQDLTTLGTTGVDVHVTLDNFL